MPKPSAPRRRLSLFSIPEVLDADFDDPTGDLELALGEIAEFGSLTGDTYSDDTRIWRKHLKHQIEE